MEIFFKKNLNVVRIKGKQFGQRQRKNFPKKYIKINAFATNFLWNSTQIPEKLSKNAIEIFFFQTFTFTYLINIGNNPHEFKLQQRIRPSRINFLRRADQLHRLQQRILNRMRINHKFRRFAQRFLQNETTRNRRPAVINKLTSMNLRKEYKLEW